jgi:predicted DsbA family dithiol-disulfide isomerase
MSESLEDQRPTTLPVVVFGDFVCPYSYIAQLEVDQLMQAYDVQPLWRPHWLHPEVPPEGMTYEAHRAAHPPPDAGGAGRDAGSGDESPSRENADRRVTTMAGLMEMSPEMARRMRFPDKLQSSFLAFVAMEFAQDQGLAARLRTAIFDALWIEGRDIGDVNTILRAAEKAGLDVGTLWGALLDPVYHERTFRAVLSARRIGITVTPTIILGRAKIVGWHYYEVLQSVVEQQGVVPRSSASAPSAG